jgi:dTDP-4-dehydrorhamnose reductase
MTTRVLVVGGTGMLGHKLAQVLSSEPGLDVHASVRSGPPAQGFAPRAVTYHRAVDLANGSAAIAGLLRSLAPDVVVNAVGAIKQKDLYSAVDATFYLNATLPHLLALLNPNPAGRLIHFSTDCVFKGDRGGYTEADAPDAEDLYGRSKACGEVDYGRHLTLRTSIIGFEITGHLGLLSWFLRQPKGSALPGYEGAIYSGLPTATLSRTVLRIIREGDNLSGLYEVASEPISKLDLLRRVNDAFGLGHTLRPDPSVRIDRSLDDARFRAATGTPRPGWDELVDDLVRDYRSLPYADVYAAPAATC